VSAIGRPVALGLDSLFRPASIALVGASDRPGSRGAELLANLRSIGYGGTLYPVNPSRDRVGGMTCYPSLLDLPAVPETVAIGVAAERTLDVVRDAVKVGSRAITIVGAGFAESGQAGAQVQAEIAATCRAHGVLLCGPNCLGVWSRLDHVAYWLAGGNDLPLSGIGLVIQSGALASSIIDPLELRGLSVDVIATVGNEAGLTAADYLAELVRDPRIRAVGVVIEGIRDAEGMLRALDEAGQDGKPVAVMKLGRSEPGGRAALAHTASLAGEHRVASAVLDQRGAILVDDLDLLIETLVLAGSYPRGIGPRVLYATVSGAGAGMVADLASAERVAPVALPEPVRSAIDDIMPGVRVANPLDVAMAGDRPGLFAECLAIAAASPELDSVALALNVSTATHPNGTRFYVEQVDALAAFVAAGKPALAFTLTSGGLDPEVAGAARRVGVPVLIGSREAIKAIGGLARVEPRRPGITADRPTTRHRGSLPGPVGALIDEVEAKGMLASWGVPTVTEGVATDPERAVAVAQRLGYPVAVKALAAGLVHKSDVGGVRLGLSTGDEVREAFREIERNVRAAGSALDGVVIQRVVDGGIELIVGTKRDDVFGHVILLGWGGLFVELLPETSIRRVPIDRHDALAMIEELPASAILRGARGRSPYDLEAVVDVLIAVSELTAAAGDRLEAIDINPLIVLGEGSGAVAVDATIQMRKADG
jgi:acetate---CoA ligase (ADP-forming)